MSNTTDLPLGDGPARLRRDAETLAGPLPPLLAAAEHLAASVMMGEHGRRRTGQGDEFWQYRPSHAGDAIRMIDWRRSAKADDALFVREKEWQAAQSVMIWLDMGQSMQFSSAKSLPTKAHDARRLALALSVLLIRGGERVGLTNLGLPPRAAPASVDAADFGDGRRRRCRGLCGAATWRCAVTVARGVHLGFPGRPSNRCALR